MAAAKVNATTLIYFEQAVTGPASKVQKALNVCQYSSTVMCKLLCNLTAATMINADGTIHRSTSRTQTVNIKQNSL